MGAGAWGTALAKVFADAGNDVTLWSRRAELADEINDTHRNPDYIGDVALPESIRATGDAGVALDGACTVLLAVPSQTLAGQPRPLGRADRRRRHAGQRRQGHRAGHADADEPGVVQVTGADPARVAVVTGPEPGQRDPRRAAGGDRRRVHRLRPCGGPAAGAFHPVLPPVHQSDVVGAEVGGACKNVIALACGMAAGVGLGENTAAAIITRGLAEIMRLGIALGAKPATLAGLAGVGDLVATCTSPQSRNRTFGERLGRGGPMESALAGGRARRGGCHVVRVGAGAGGELRRGDAADRRRSSGVPQRTVGARGGRAAARPQHQAGVRRDRPVRRLHPQRQSRWRRSRSREPGHTATCSRVPAYHLPADEADPLDSYGRSSNPTWRQLESALAELEGATAALTFGSGMAAITSVLRVARHARRHAGGARRRLLPGPPVRSRIPCAARRHRASRRRAPTCAPPRECRRRTRGDAGQPDAGRGRPAPAGDDVPGPRRHPRRRQHHPDTAWAATAVARRRPRGGQRDQGAVGSQRPARRIRRRAARRADGGGRAERLLAGAILGAFEAWLVLRSLGTPGCGSSASARTPWRWR